LIEVLKNLLVYITILIFSNDIIGQIRLLEVDPSNDRITIKNFGASTVNISAYRLCARFSYTANLTSVNLESGDLNLAAGAMVVLSGWPLNNVHLTLQYT